MATSTGYGTNIRQSLVGNGVNNADIGYNKSNGYVTVKGQDFMKAGKVLDGVSYDTGNNFGSAWNSYSNKSTGAPKTPYNAPSNAPSFGSTTGVSTGNTNYAPKSTASTAPIGSVGVRSALQSSGYDPKSIGYSNGAVTVNGQNFGTGANINGSVSMSPTQYKNNLTDFRIGDLTNQVVNSNKLPENAYTQQIQDNISYLMDKAKNPTTIDPYSTPEYAAYEAQSDRRVQQGTRAAQESLGSSGFGRSTMLGERAQGIQNAETEYLNTQMIPQILANEQAKQQQQYNNLLQMLDPMVNQQSFADNRAQTERGNIMDSLKYVTGEQQRGYDNNRADAALTGTYLTPAQQSAIDALMGLKQQAELPGTSAAQRSVLTKQADTVRNNMKSLGLDPTMYGANVSYNSASQNKVGRTLQGQQFDETKRANASAETFRDAQQGWENNFQTEQQAYKSARDAISDNQWKAQFDQSVSQFGLNYALNQLQQTDQVAYQQAQLALSQDDNSRQWATLDYDMSKGADAAKYNGMTATQVIDNARKMFASKDKNGVETFPTAEEPLKQEEIYKYVGNLGMPYGQDDQVMFSLGLSKETIAALDKKYELHSGN